MACNVPRRPYEAGPDGRRPAAVHVSHRLIQVQSHKNGGASKPMRQMSFTRALVILARLMLHLGQHIHQEHELAVAGASDERQPWVSSVLDHEARVLETAFAAQALQVGFQILP